MYEVKDRKDKRRAVTGMQTKFDGEKEIKTANRQTNTKRQIR